MKTKHTPEPWADGPARPNGEVLILGEVTRTVAYVPTASGFYNADVARANSARIVACVNFCAGIDPAAVPDLLAACEALAANVDEQERKFGHPIEWHPSVAMMRAALAKASGKTAGE